jgi:hypothetical protein
LHDWRAICFSDNGLNGCVDRKNAAPREADEVASCNGHAHQSDGQSAIAVARFVRRVITLACFIDSVR